MSGIIYTLTVIYFFYVIYMVFSDQIDAFVKDTSPGSALVVSKFMEQVNKLKRPSKISG